jgi:uncharacterized membrane-anchored protein YjiN (DUF445 family)
MLDFHQTRRLASLLVLGVAALLGVALFYGQQTAWYWPWIAAFAEAALVGALADWFAVTALFRRPLGLPIPHTAIIPKNQDRIAEALGHFVQSNFLSEEIVSERVARVYVGEALSAWLAVAENRVVVARKVAPIALGTLNALDDARLRDAIGAASGSVLRMLDAPTTAAHALEVFLGSSEQQSLFDQMLKVVEHALSNHEVELREVLRKEMPWYVPTFIHNKVYRDVIAKLRQTLSQANADSSHTLRISFSRYVARLATELRVSTQLRSEVNSAWQDLLRSKLGQQYLGSVLTEVRLKLSEFLTSKPDVFEALLERWLGMFSDALSSSSELRAGLNALSVRLAQGLARNYRDEVAGLVSETVKRWDADTIVDKLESQVGKDLQFIRINGTVVGGLIGLLLHWIKSLV